MQNFIPQKYIVTVAITLAITLGYQANAAVQVDGNGQVSISQGMVLGDSTDNSGESQDNSGSGNSGSSDNSNSSDNQPTETPKPSETPEPSETPKPSETPEPSSHENSTTGKSASHTLLPDGTQIETQTEGGKAQVEIQAHDTKINIKQEDGIYKIKTEQADGTQQELPDQTEVTVDKSNLADKTKIITLQKKAIVDRLLAQAITNLPLSIDTTTNQLSVTTAKGTIPVAVLPDQAVQNLLQNSIIDNVTTPTNIQQDPTGVDTNKDTVNLEEEDGTPVYNITGTKDKKLLGLFNYKAEIDTTVSAQTGAVLSTKKSLWTTILGLISTNA